MTDGEFPRSVRIGVRSRHDGPEPSSDARSING